jgi:hypothetical protein
MAAIHPDYHFLKDRSPDYAVLKVPAQRIHIIWNYVIPHLMAGMTVAPELGIDDIVEGLSDESIQLWIVTKGQVIEAAFLTSIENDRGDWVVSLYALGGKHAKHWLRECDAVMDEFARQEGAVRVRMCGRKAWQRLLPESFAVIGERGGHNVYERCIQ